MKKKPLVTSIITTYKREVKVVERALLSIINQTYKNIEIIIVNDCPSEVKLANDLKEMIAKYQSSNNIKYIVVEKNGGACKARNIGIENATGEYIAFLDDDDEWLPEKVELQLQSLLENNEYALSYCNSYFYNVDKQITTLRFKVAQPTGDIYSALLEKNIVGSCSFPMFRADVLKEFNGFSEDMPAMQDWELYMRICENNKAVYIDKPLIRYYKYEGERISRNSTKRIAAFEIMKNRYIDKIATNKQALYNFYLLAANDYSIGKKTLTALKYCFKAISIKPFKIKNNLYFIAKIFARIFVDKNNM